MEEEIGEPEEKTPGAKTRSINKNSTHMWYQVQESHHMLCFYIQSNTWV